MIDGRIAAIFHLPETGGPGRTLLPRLRRLAESASLDVVVPAQGGTAALYEPFARIVPLEYMAATLPASTWQYAGFVRRFARDVALFRRYLRSARPDLIVVVSTVLPAAVVAARLGRVPLVVYAAEILDRGHVGGVARTLWGAVTRRLIAGTADAIVACSGAVAAQFRRDGGDVVVIYPGISHDYAHGSPELYRKGGPTIAVVGALTRGRGQDVALRAMPALQRSFPGIHCLFAGSPHPRSTDQEYARSLRGLAAELGVADAVTFLGHVENVADVYAATDVVVNPARFNEPFGRVALEAIVAGRPVVATRVGAIPEVLRDRRDALLVAPEQPEAIADAVATLLFDDALARRLVERGRARVLSGFTEEAGVGAFLATLERVLGRRAQRSRFVL